MKSFFVVAIVAMLLAVATAAPHHETGHTHDEHDGHTTPVSDHVHVAIEETTTPVAEAHKDETLAAASSAYLASPYAYSAYPAVRAYPYAAYGAYPYGYPAYGGYPLYYH